MIENNRRNTFQPNIEKKYLYNKLKNKINDVH
jgi:hypothetical protein